MSLKDEEVSQVPDQLMDQLLKGYDSLRTEVKALSEQRRRLEARLDFAIRQYSNLQNEHSSATDSLTTDNFPRDVDRVPLDEHDGATDWLEDMSKAEDPDRRTRGFNVRVADDAREKLRNRQQEVSGVRIWAGRSADKRGSVSSKLRHELERDFTVPGTPSKLGCPFAVRTGGSTRVGQRGLPTPRSSNSKASGSLNPAMRRLSGVDPIKEDLCGNDPMSPAVSEHGSFPLCPIRFMDQHSPEEVAEYFEKHKHQIPRSHESCIKRYQGDSESVKHLDAKYGSLVSMIQGLGQKHQPILAEKEVEDEDGDGPKNETVSVWANDVSASLQKQGPTEEDPAKQTDERLPHFDRPLKDIRLGESPSRPWGIAVPAKYEEDQHAPSEGSAITASPQELSVPKDLSAGEGEVRPPSPARKCPFNHGGQAPQELKASGTEPHPLHSTPTFIKAESPKSPDAAAEPPRMLLTGPVFIGYSVDEAIQLLRATGHAPKT